VGDVSTEVTVAFRPDLVSAWLSNGEGPPMLAELADEIIASGFGLRQLHPGSTDPDVAAWFAVSASSLDGARRAVAQLQWHPAVVTAYIKPPEAPPG
jgi:hypothetical protein